MLLPLPASDKLLLFTMTHRGSVLAHIAIPREHGRAPILEHFLMCANLVKCAVFGICTVPADRQKYVRKLLSYFNFLE